MNEIINSRVAVAARQAVSNSDWAIQCDFDGTISTVDVTDSLLTRFGRDGYEELEDAWVRGEIGSRVCMQKQIALLDMSMDELHAHLDTIQIDPAFPAFVREAQVQGLPLQIVSDGMDYVISYVLQGHGLRHLPVLANHLVQTGPRSWRLESPHASAACSRNSGTCKCALLATQKLKHPRVLFIGDGTSDFCVSGKADFVLATSRLLEHCRKHDYPHAAFADFRQALALLQQIISNEEVQA
jgi:2-hydroxy-3-keto-5-methylthiopentenyl-1-phosphate phosphatase